MRWSIRVRVITLVGVFVLLMVANFLVLRAWIQGASTTAREINLAGRQRMLTQQITKDALMIREGVCQRAELEEGREQFSRTLAGLLEGDAELGLTRAEDPAIRAKLQEVDSLWQSFLPLARRIAEREDANREELARLQASSFDLLTTMNTAVGLMESEANAAMARLRTTTLILLVLSLGTALVAYLIVRRTVLERLDVVTRTMGGITATHDLNARLPEKPADEVGRAAAAFNLMIGTFQENTREVQRAARDLENHAALVATNSRDTRTRTAEQFHALESVSAAMQEMAASVKEVAHGTVEAATQADRVHREATTGGTAVSGAIASIGELVREVESAASTMDRLDVQASEIRGIVDAIGQIADQTKLLAVNAAIEAEHAGDQGLGFKVVAREMERLARHTETATRDVESVVARLRERIATAVEEIREGGERARGTAVRAAETTNALTAIAEAATGMQATNHRIAAAAEQQSVAADDVSGNLLSLKSLAEATADSGQLAVETGERLGAVADRLRALTLDLKT